MGVFRKKHRRYGNTLKTYKTSCFYCGTKLDEYSRTVDHIIPECDGGIRSNDNKVYSCYGCNQLKANMHPDEFKIFLGNLIRFEQINHTKNIGYLKKVRIRVTDLIKHRKKKR